MRMTSYSGGDTSADYRNECSRFPPISLRPLFTLSGFIVSGFEPLVAVFTVFQNPFELATHFGFEGFQRVLEASRGGHLFFKLLYDGHQALDKLRTGEFDIPSFS